MGTSRKEPRFGSRSTHRPCFSPGSFTHASDLRTWRTRWSRSTSDGALDPDPWETLPAELREFLSAQSPDHAGADRRPSAEQLIRMAIERVGGGRNNAGTWLACQLRDNGYSTEDARAAMRQFRGCAPATNSKGEREEYTDSEIDATIKSIFGTPKRDAWGSRTAGNQAKEQEDEQRRSAMHRSQWLRSVRSQGAAVASV